MKILVTGGAGFIGSHFIKHILRKYPDYKVVNFDLLTYAGNLDNLRSVENNPNYSFIKGDIADPIAVNELVKNADLVVNFAAETHVDRSIKDPTPFLRTNVMGTHNLLEACKNNGGVRFHHISTDEVYGDLGPNDPPFNEQTIYRPRNPYSATKASSDCLVRSYHHTFGLPVTISNCTNNYGPFQYPEKIHALFITNLLKGKKAAIHGDGKNIRDWLYVEDHCEAIDLIVHKGRPGESYCIGGASEKSNLEIALEILKLLGYGEDSIEFIADRPGNDRRYAMNFTKIKEELGWEPRHSFEEGMKKTVDWHKENMDWWKMIKNDDGLLNRH